MFLAYSVRLGPSDAQSRDSLQTQSGKCRPRIYMNGTLVFEVDSGAHRSARTSTGSAKQRRTSEAPTAPGFQVLVQIPSESPDEERVEEIRKRNNPTQVRYGNVTRLLDDAEAMELLSRGVLESALIEHITTIQNESAPRRKLRTSLPTTSCILQQ